MESPKHFSLVALVEAFNPPGGEVTAAESLAVQPFASVTVTLYEPIATPVWVGVVGPFDHL